MDSCLLLPPANTPLSGYPLSHRMPCGDAEKMTRVVGDVVRMRSLEGMMLGGEGEGEVVEEEEVKEGDVLQLGT